MTDVSKLSKIRYTLSIYNLRYPNTSQPIQCGNLPWKLKTSPSNRFFGLFMQCDNGDETPPWCCNASVDFMLKSFNPTGTNFTRARITTRFTAEKNVCGYRNFISWTMLQDPKRGFIHGNSITLVVTITTEPLRKTINPLPIIVENATNTLTCTNIDDAKVAASSGNPHGTQNISISMSKNDFLLYCVGLVTVKNMPLTIFDDEVFFKTLIRPYEQHFGTNLNGTTMVDTIKTVAAKIRDHISRSVVKKMVSLKIDIVTWMYKIVLIINIQYVSNSEIHKYTIGIIEIRKTHTAQYLKEIIVECLTNYNIEFTQVYTCILDSGKNVMKTAKLSAELQAEMLTQVHENPGGVDENYETIHYFLSFDFEVVKCAELAVEIVAQDVFKTMTDKIVESLNILKELLAQSLNREPQILQSPTHWISTFHMLSCLTNLDRPDGNPNLAQIDWNFVYTFVAAFRPLAELTGKFHNDQYIVGDFYRDWLCCEVELEELFRQENAYAQLLLLAMQAKKQLLLTDKVIAAALYLDGRFNFAGTPLLTEEQKILALDHLVETNEIVKRLFHPTATLALSKFSKLESKVNLQLQQNMTPDQSIRQKLENLACAERIPFETNILGAWKNPIYRDAELASLVDAALSVPTTHANVDAIDALPTILSKHTDGLPMETIQNILLVRLNNHFMKDINIVENVE